MVDMYFSLSSRIAGLCPVNRDIGIDHGGLFRRLADSLNTNVRLAIREFFVKTRSSCSPERIRATNPLGGGQPGMVWPGPLQDKFSFGD